MLVERENGVAEERRRGDVARDREQLTNARFVAIGPATATVLHRVPVDSQSTLA
jgi:hypothetical protein